MENNGKIILFHLIWFDLIRCGMLNYNIITENAWHLVILVIITIKTGQIHFISICSDNGYTVSDYKCLFITYYIIKTTKRIIIDHPFSKWKYVSGSCIFVHCEGKVFFLFCFVLFCLAQYSIYSTNNRIIRWDYETHI